ncbi:TPA: hypothetical protein L6B58_06490 [Pseudomonas aeruginosa]|nr:hypothetical protein IPC1223_04030 [Pseudomonas aeruginosa]HBP5733220.1 hypothetical protein [Pseudomonas aeruginosa]
MIGSTFQSLFKKTSEIINLFEQSNIINIQPFDILYKNLMYFTIRRKYQLYRFFYRRIESHLIVKDFLMIREKIIARF